METETIREDDTKPNYADFPMSAFMHYDIAIRRLLHDYRKGKDKPSPLNTNTIYRPRDHTWKYNEKEIDEKRVRDIKKFWGQL